MTPSCCPDCGSAATVGVEVASVCTDCAVASVAGFSFSLPMLLAAVTAVAVVSVVAKRLPRLMSGLRAATA